MTEPALNVAIFYCAWIPAVLLSSTTGLPSPSDIVMSIGGFEWPLVTLVLAATGVLAARPLSPRGNPPLSWGKNFLVTLIMLIVALLWVIDSRPGLLFSFIVSIGLGFSGYSLIELMGEEIKAFAKRIFSTATEFLGRLSKKKED